MIRMNSKCRELCEYKKEINGDKQRLMEINRDKQRYVEINRDWKSENQCKKQCKHCVKVVNI